jgi:chaperonin GroEL (HSP60 family)
MPKPGLILSPEATAYLQSGFNRICKLVSVTLGPLQGGVLVSNDQRDGYPEIVEDAGMIARRIISLPDQRENPGAMLARSMVWRARQRAGDGGAITAGLLWLALIV